MSYVPKVNDYVIWNHHGVIHEGWVYFVDSVYITIETGVKPKPNCEYTKQEKHKLFSSSMEGSDLCEESEEYLRLNGNNGYIIG